MATAVFDGTGADPTDFNADDNWSGGSGTSGKPGATDDVEIRALTRPITGNTGAFAAVNITSLKVTGACEKSVGTAASPIQFGTCTTFDYNGRGTSAFFNLSPTTAKVNVGVGREFVMVGGTWATVIGSGPGSILKGASATVTTVKSVGPRWRDEAGAAYVTFTAVAGSANLRCSVGTLHAHVPVLTEGAAAITSKAWVYPTGQLTHWSSGTIADAEVQCGKLSWRGTPHKAAVITDHTVWEGSTVQYDSPGFVLTQTNVPTKIGSPASVGVTPAAAA